MTYLTSHRALVSIVACAILALFGTMFYISQRSTLGDTTVVTIGGTPVSVDIASTQAEREQGLSGHAPLAGGRGMLFVFPSDGTYGFWMKDMRFSLDIIWANSEDRVVTVWRDLSPATYPEVFYPTSASRYVLEVSAGFAVAHNIATGTPIVLPAGI